MKACVTTAEFTTAGFGDGRLTVVVERHGTPGVHPDPKDFPADVIAALVEWLSSCATGRCYDRAPSLVRAALSQFCVLDRGHGGWHEAASGMHWINEAPRTAPAATQADQQTESAPAPVRDANEAQKRPEPFLTNAFAVTPEMGRYLDETAPPSTPPCFTALDGTEDPA